MLNPVPSSIVDDHKIRDTMSHVPISAWWGGDAIFAVVIILVGVTAGLGGMLLALLLHAIQHAAYGYDLGAVVSPESFLQGVTAASPMRRVRDRAMLATWLSFWVGLSAEQTRIRWRNVRA